jgi:transposase
MEMVDAIGLDMSKETFDARIHTARLARKFPNTKAGFRKLLKWVSASGLMLEKVRFCAENTGLYSHQISEFLTTQEVHFSLVPALQIKKSLGITRGKSDELDAQRIAEYAYLRRDTLENFVPLSTSIQALKNLLRLRAKLVSTRHRFEVTVSEAKHIFQKKDHRVFFNTQESMVKYTNKRIKAVEKGIEALINCEPELLKMYQLLQSIIGIGPVIAGQLIVYTGGFRRFKTWRQFACYIGVAPFPYESGPALKGNSKVSHLAHKELKTLFFLASSTARQHDPELRRYYEQRISNGKSEMSTLNIISNKLLARAFAVVQRGTPYVKLHAYAA